jgi:hypothetical protein
MGGGYFQTFSAWFPFLWSNLNTTEIEHKICHSICLNTNQNTADTANTNFNTTDNWENEPLALTQMKKDNK